MKLLHNCSHLKMYLYNRAYLPQLPGVPINLLTTLILLLDSEIDQPVSFNMSIRAGIPRI